MTISSHFRKPFVIWFWVYGMVLVVATHAPAKDVQFLARAVDYGLLDPDKLLHLTAYSVLGLLAVLAYGGRWRKPSSAVVWLFPLLTAWGMLDEWTQPFFGRLADGHDLIYDILGVGIGLTAGIFASRWLRQPSLP